MGVEIEIPFCNCFRQNSRRSQQRRYNDFSSECNAHLNSQTLPENTWFKKIIIFIIYLNL